MYELIDQKNLAKLHLHDIEDKIRPLGNDGSSSVVMITKKLLQKIESMRNSNADGAV